MTVASGSRHSLGYIKEVVRGTTPADPAFQLLRHRSTTLDMTRDTIESQELRDDRMISDFRLGVKHGVGNIVGELSTGTYDELLANALQGTWSGAGNGATLKNGVVRSTYSMLRRFGDIGQWNLYRGAEINTLALAVTPQQQVLATFGVMADGMIIVPDNDDLKTDATFVAQTTTETLTGLTGGLYEGIGGAAVLAPCSELNINLDNGMQDLLVLGRDTAYDRSTGRSRISGTSTFYFEGPAIYQKFINDTASAIKFQIRDGLGTSGYDILLPRVKYTGAPLPVQNEGPVTLNMTWQALYDAATNCEMQITRVLAP